MTNRQLLYAIGEIDEKYIVSAEKRQSKEDKKRIFNIIKSVAAAVFAVAVIGAVWAISYKNVSSRINPADTTQSENTDPVADNAPDLYTAAEIYLSRSGNGKVAYADKADKNTVYSDDLRKIYFCMRLSGGYAVLENAYGEAYPDGPDGEDLGTYHFYYPDGRPLQFIDRAGGEKVHIVTARDKKLIDADDIDQLYDAYSEFLDSYNKSSTTFDYNVPEAENGETFKVTIKYDSAYSDIDLKNNEYIAAYLKYIYLGLHEDYSLRMPMVADEMINKNIFSHNAEDGKYDKYFTQKAAELGYSYDEAVARATEIARTIYPVTINEVSFSFNGIYELSKGDFLSLSEFSSYIERYGIDADKITKAVCIYTDNINVRFNDIINLPLNESTTFRSFVVFEYKGKNCVFDRFSPETPIGYLEDAADGKIDTIEFTVTVFEAAEHAFIDTDGCVYVSEKPLDLSARDVVNVEFYRDYDSFVRGVVSVQKAD